MSLAPPLNPGYHPVPARQLGKAGLVAQNQVTPVSISKTCWGVTVVVVPKILGWEERSPEAVQVLETGLEIIIIVIITNTLQKAGFLIQMQRPLAPTGLEVIIIKTLQRAGLVNQILEDRVVLENLMALVRVLVGLVVITIEVATGLETVLTAAKARVVIAGFQIQIDKPPLVYRRIQMGEAERA